MCSWLYSIWLIWKLKRDCDFTTSVIISTHFSSCKDRTCCILFNMHCFLILYCIGILCFAYYKIGLSEYFVSNSWLGINQVTQDLKFLYLHTLNSDDNFTINYLDLNASWFPRARNFAKSYSCNNEQLHTTKECLP